MNDLTDVLNESGVPSVVSLSVSSGRVKPRFPPLNFVENFRLIHCTVVSTLLNGCADPHAGSQFCNS